MTIISVVLHVKPSYVRHFQHSPRRRLQSAVCKNLSRGYTALGVYHSHHKESLGGGFSPHIHFSVDVPEHNTARFISGLPEDLRQKDKQGYFELSARKTWKTFDTRPLWQAEELWKYVIGTGRINEPAIVYGRV